MDTLTGPSDWRKGEKLPKARSCSTVHHDFYGHFLGSENSDYTLNHAFYGQITVFIATFSTLEIAIKTVMDCIIKSHMGSLKITRKNKSF